MNSQMLYRPAPAHPAGRIVTLRHSSQVLQNNPWQDPTERDVAVYLPHGYDEQHGPYPVLWDLAAYTSAGPAHINWRNHGENLPQRLDRLIAEQRMPPCLCVFPDCYTSLGGNQYVNSSAVGHYADYLVEELIPFIDSQFATLREAAGRIAFGKSSGGYGALYLASQYPGVWGAIAAHAPDVGFDRVYLPDFPKVCTTLEPFRDDPRELIRAFWQRKQPKGHEFHAMMTLCLAASYDPDPTHPWGFRLPFTLDTCELDNAAWQRWLAYDPLQLAHQHRDALQQLQHLWLDVGNRDQYNIQYGSRQLSRLLTELNIAHHFEEFEGTHSGIDWRLDHSLPQITAHLRAADNP
ncbi:MAG: alpha/beta hydrolase-fold protein [Wenzhouxiangellaceae bacterium]